MILRIEGMYGFYFLTVNSCLMTLSNILHKILILIHKLHSTLLPLTLRTQLRLTLVFIKSYLILFLRQRTPCHFSEWKCLFAAGSPTDTVGSQNFHILSTRQIAFLVAEWPTPAMLLRLSASVCRRHRS